ncbi:MAG: response regulator transcription factor [Gammaproteobacteria bacterium]|nr:response regulator transcription factor [Gammaproteobacteria bacterium]NIR98015.1 response regulator transcription factor [Gammaproteobacteria bacterium]NIT63714.1 response regulator transcription factor [Gammaproteobacteria bacterium]NIV20678.1 response regulator [Gammaproteobacteria bacterium]NIX11386.1 response regulator [Gammaproteobacteria bacterium]
MGRRILVVEDNRDIARLVAMHLGDLGCEVETCADGDGALRRARARAFDLIILDLMLPGLDGLELCRRLRARPDYVPILMLTAKSSELDRVLGLELGADDYVTKPFSIRELLARVKALFRRVDALEQAPSEQAAPLCVDGLEIHPEKRQVRVNGAEVALTAKEFDLLLHFARHPGRVYTRAQLLDGVWGYGHEGYEHTVNSHINRLRAKIEHSPAQPRYILTVWGVGYKFAEHPGDG